MKIPWTPGPWLRDGSHIYSPDRNAICRFMFYGDLGNIALVSKAPEMAELLIELVEILREPPSLDHPVTELANDAKKLLTEIGYDPEMDEDPAD